MRHQILRWVVFGWLAWSGPLYALQVTVSIPPLAGMIAPLLDDEDTLQVLLKPGVSPHGFQLKPSQLWQLQDSDLVVSVGTPVDGWLEKSLVHVKAPVTRMSALNNIETLPVRRGGLWEKHDSGERHSAHHEEESHEHDAVHPVLGYDGHLWLSMNNAHQLIEAAALQLQQLKPEAEERIAERTRVWLLQLSELDRQLKARLAAFSDVPFIVLHDAYQYFEHHYGLNGVGSIRLNPDVAPSLKRIQSLRQSIHEQNVRCVFKEPQFPEKRIRAVVSGSEVKLGSLDPIGVYDEQGKLISAPFMRYDRLLIHLAEAFEACLMNDEKPSRGQ